MRHVAKNIGQKFRSARFHLNNPQMPELSESMKEYFKTPIDLFREGRGTSEQEQACLDFEKYMNYFDYAGGRDKYFAELNSLPLKDIKTDDLNGLARERIMGAPGVPKDAVRGYELYSESASRKDIDGMYYVAHCLLNGDGVERNIPEAYERFSSLDQLYKHSQAQLALGLMLQQGQACDKNEKAGFEKIKASSDNGYAVAHYYLAKCYENGIGVEVNEYDAFEAHLLAVGVANQNSMIQVASWYYSGYKTADGKVVVPPNLRLAFDYSLTLANLGNTKGMFMTGISYCTGDGLPSAEVKAGDSHQTRVIAQYQSGREWLEKALVGGFGLAAVQLGVLYKVGVIDSSVPPSVASDKWDKEQGVGPATSAVSDASGPNLQSKAPFRPNLARACAVFRMGLETEKDNAQLQQLLDECQRLASGKKQKRKKH